MAEPSALLAGLGGGFSEGGASFTRAYLDALNRKQRGDQAGADLDFRKQKWKEYLSTLIKPKPTQQAEIYSGTRMKQVM